MCNYFYYVLLKIFLNKNEILYRYKNLRKYFLSSYVPITFSPSESYFHQNINKRERSHPKNKNEKHDGQTQAITMTIKIHNPRAGVSKRNGTHSLKSP